MVKYGTEQMNNFHKFRHDQKKVDKLRGLLRDNLDYIEKGSQQLVSAAAPVFPPAAAIGMAFTYMLSACRHVSADYDVVTAFFEDMNSFLQRITILESRLPSYPAYRNCLMDVLTSLLEMCGFATKYIELGRFKKWILNMVRGEDGDLGGARKKMDTSLTRLQAATEYAILGNTEELQRMNADLQKNQEVQIQRMEQQTQMLETVLERQDGVRTDLMSIHKLLVVFNERRQEDIFVDTMNPAHEYQDIKDSLIPETCSWIFDEPTWGEWVAQEKEKNTPRILVLSGPPGTGKSHLAACAHDQLVKLAERDAGSNTCVAHFYFREATDGLNAFHNAINWITVQIAEQNAALCERINVEMARDDIEFYTSEWEDIWGKFVKPLFYGSSTARLQIVLDGMDELVLDSESKKALEFLQLVKETADLNVSILCTTRSSMVPKLAGLAAGWIAVTKEKQLADMKALIWNHLNNDSRLRNNLEEKADCILYAEHMLRQFNNIGREPIILKQLEQSMPENLKELYGTILVDLQRRTADDKQQAIKGLLWWLAFASRPLTLAESFSLMNLFPGSSLDLEEELQGQQLARLLKIGDVEERAQNDGDNSNLANVDLLGQSDPDAVYDDGDRPLKFQERSMRDYFRSASQDEQGLRTPGRVAHGKILTLCSKILFVEVDNIYGSLRKYAAQHWIWHFACWCYLSLNSNPGPAEDEKVACLEALGAIMTNHGNFATTIESLDMDYEDVLRDLPNDYLVAKVAEGATMATSLGDKMIETTLTWARDVVADKGAAFVTLVKGHISNWFRAQDLKSAAQSYKVIRSIIPLTSFSHLIKPKDDDSDSDDSSSDSDDEGPQYEEEEILGIVGAFEVVEKDANAHWAIAAVLADCQHYQAAHTELQVALSACVDPVERFRILNLLASAKLNTEDKEGAAETIANCLSNREVSLSLLRKALVTRGRIQVALEKLDEAVGSYDEARRADPNEPMRGDLLQEEFDVYRNKEVEAGAELIRGVRGWQPLERLAWMTWNYDDFDDYHDSFRQAAGWAGERDFMIRAYEEVIGLLESVDAAPPMRFELAQAQWRVCEDAAAARAELDKVLDSSSTGNPYRFTDEDPTYTLVRAVMLATNIIHEQFRATADREFKARLLDEAKGLTRRGLAHSVSSTRSGLTPYMVWIARMVRKMGPAKEFEDALRAAFNVCYDALTDNVGWNDSMNLDYLAMTISSLDGMEREARILVSAGFYELTKEEGNDEDDEDEDDDDDKHIDDGCKHDTGGDNTQDKDDDFDLDDNSYYCDGECKPVKKWALWKDGPMYLCLDCFDCDLCEACYVKRQAYNSGTKCEVGSTYCGPNHRYAKGPLEGWRGIKDGVMRIDGEEPIRFTDWLKDLKEKKWEAAWETFWRAEC
ncbi:hypothetical protein QBC33DRAFT_612002 [Phialemonium atrogriseum]|uniref:Fungal STAND N-terminal Goodbye domain-containing protein n=1 Tax=Phialemonium atrogriseum TaxID=1093897 RepID=A0AAJ0C285_9PEZI|nr:uncharacterized protein QBC33DRAFT_612002 [Phialemonium atrogriseum]KAK1766356.1 hypothetical protein QBC33DRAFT_612002 [Phialemonium atrogriseum]